LEVRTPSGREPNAITGDQRLARLVVGTSTTDRVLDGTVEVDGDGNTLARVLFPAQDPQMDNQSL
jgi:hypothetical protein